MCFGEYEVNAASGELRKGGTRLKIHPQPFRVLLLLAERSGQIVSREDIRRCLWGDNTYVDFEGGINFCVKQIRDVLGDDADNPRYLQTIPRQGYRFIAAISPVATKHLHLVSGPGSSGVVELRPEGHGRISVADAKSAHEEDVGTAASKPREKMWRWWALVAAAAVAVAVAGWGWNRWKRGAAEIPRQASESQLTANPPEDFVRVAAISPDGKYVVYADQSQLLVRSIDSGEIRRVALPAEFPAAQIEELTWLPEGGELLATRRASVSEATSLWSVPVLGEGVPKKLRAETTSPAISPDGKWMVFRSGGLHQPKEIWVSGSEGERARKLLGVENNAGTGNPVWSPDGKWIAYERFRWNESGIETSIEIQAANGGNARRLVSEAALGESGKFTCRQLGCVSWSADWKLLFAVENRLPAEGIHPRMSLWEVQVNPGDGTAKEKPQRLTEWVNATLTSLTMTVDGKVLAFVKEQERSDAYLGELEPGMGSMPKARRFTLDNHDSYPETWTKDGESLFFISNRNGKQELFKQGIDKEVPEKVVSGGTGELVRGSKLSADGMWILYWERIEEKGRGKPVVRSLLREPSGGGPAEKVLEVEATPERWYDVDCAQSEEGGCVLGVLEGSDFRFYALDPVKGKGEELGKIEVSRNWTLDWSVSPDGREIAEVDHNHKDKIEVLELGKRSWREIAVEPGRGDFHTVAWEADGKGFFVSTFLPESFNLLHVTARGKAQVLESNPQTLYMNRLRPSPDGKYLAFEGEMADSNVWLLKDY